MNSIKNNLLYFYDLSAHSYNRVFSCLPSRKDLMKKIGNFWAEHQGKIAILAILVSGAHVSYTVKQIQLDDFAHNEKMRILAEEISQLQNNKNCLTLARRFSQFKPASEEVQNKVRSIGEDFGFSNEKLQDIGIFKAPIDFESNHVAINLLKNCEEFSHLTKYRLHLTQETIDQLKDVDRQFKAMGAIAHELGHIAHGHVDKPYVKQIDELAEKSKDREEEREADLWTAQAKSSKYLKGLIQRFKDICVSNPIYCECTPNAPCPDSEFSTHPPLWERINYLEQALRAHPDRDLSENECIGRDGDYY